MKQIVIYPEKWPRVLVGRDLRNVTIEQSRDLILIDPAAIPALIAALQAAATEAEGRGDE